MKKLILIAGSSMLMQQAVAQDRSDSLGRAVAASVLKSYPIVRPFNLEYDVNGRSQYNLRLLGKDFTEGNITRFTTLKASANLPLLLRKRLILTTTLSYNGVNMHFTDENTAGRPLERRESSHAVGVAITGIWRDSIWNRPLIVTAAATTRTDFGNDAFVAGFMTTGTLLLKANAAERVGLGLSVIATPGSMIPVMPLFTYYRRLAPTWELDLVLPSKLSLRKCYDKAGWISLGTELMTNSLLGQQDNILFQGNYEYAFISLRSGIGFERLVNRFLLFGVKGGIQNHIQARMRKVYTSANKYVSEMDRKVSTYCNISLLFIPFSKGKQ